MTDNSHEADLEDLSDYPVRDREDVSVNIKTKSKKRTAVIRVLVICLAAAAILAAGTAGAWNLLKGMGQKSLYAQVEGKHPKFPNKSDEPAGQENWQADWVRYNGKVYEFDKEILTFLVMGTDNKAPVLEGAKGAGGQSDANFLVILNPRKKEIRLLCINRDTMVDVEVYDEKGTFWYIQTAQLATQHAYGLTRQQNAEYMVRAVSRFLYDLPIHGYCSINMAAIPQINDAVGGVTLTCLEDLTKVNPLFVKGNQIYLSGQMAYHYVHYRDTGVFESNRGRLVRQKQYLGAFVSQAKTAVKENPAIITKLYDSLSKYMVTDLSLEEAVYLADTVKDYSFRTDNVITLEGETRMGEKYEEFYADEEKLQALMIELFYREINPEFRK